MGPALFAIAASDLRPLTPGNDMTKFADDVYLLVPASNSGSCELELDHIATWAKANNLVVTLNRAKSKEVIFFKRPASHANLAPIQGIMRVTSLTSLGVTISSNLRFSEHVSSTVTSANQSLFALRSLRAYGLGDVLLGQIYKATVLTKLLYCSPAWRGFATADDMNRLESVLRKASKAVYYQLTATTTISALCHAADSRLFRKVTSNPTHLLHRLLPPPVTHSHNLRPRAHNLSLPTKAKSL